MRFPRVLFPVLLLLAAAAACQAQTNPPYTTVILTNMPHVRQKPDFCGEACVEMVLKYSGRKGTQDDVFNVSRLDPALGRGCATRDLHEAVLALNIHPGDTWYYVTAANQAAQIESHWKSVHADLLNRQPTIVCMHYDDSPGTTEHFRLIVGYDAKTDEIVYHEPASDTGTFARMSRATFRKLWPLPMGQGKSAIIRLRCKLGPEPKIAQKDGFTPADFVQHIMALKKRIEDKPFTLVVETPFVVIGDENKETLQVYADRTVRWAADKLKQDFFPRDPKEIIDIWLFGTKDSYEKYTKELFGREPHTPYGFYLDDKHALIMNIATGGGTLVHEIVHPFVRANFPRCPAWLNEGLGSLYEQSSERDGHIIGLTNWRLAGLQKSIKQNDLPSFETLTKMTDDEFYGAERGDNYAQARYLCYYLQEKKLLIKFYQQFRKNFETDKSGYETLKTVLGEKDMDKFKKAWEKYVLALKFP